MSDVLAFCGSRVLEVGRLHSIPVLVLVGLLHVVMVYLKGGTQGGSRRRLICILVEQSDAGTPDPASTDKQPAHIMGTDLSTTMSEVHLYYFLAGGLDAKTGNASRKS